MGLSLPEGKYVTLGGYIFDALGHIPVEGERLEYEGWELRVVEMDKRRVAKVVAVQPELVQTGKNAGTGRQERKRTPPEWAYPGVALVAPEAKASPANIGRRPWGRSGKWRSLAARQRSGR